MSSPSISSTGRRGEVSVSLVEAHERNETPRLNADVVESGRHAPYRCSGQIGASIRPRDANDRRDGRRRTVRRRRLRLGRQAPRLAVDLYQHNHAVHHENRSRLLVQHCSNRTKMTDLLEKAFERASQLPEAEQDEFARLMLQELEADARWAALFEHTASENVLARMAREALADHRAGRTSLLDPDGL